MTDQELTDADSSSSASRSHRSPPSRPASTSSRRRRCSRDARDRGRRRADARADGRAVLHAELPAPQVDRPRRRGWHAADAGRARALDRRSPGRPRTPGLLAGRRARRLRQQRLPLPRAPVHRREGPVRAHDRRPGPLSGPDEAHPRKAQAPGRSILTTQLYFPGVARNRTRRDLRRRAAGEELAKGRRPASGPIRLRPRPFLAES